MNRFSDVESIEQLVRQTIGAASMCWTLVGTERLFDSDEALRISDEAVERLHELETHRDGYWGQPNTHDGAGHRIAP